jgi:esterase/lipase superfamily enzyme
MLLSRTLPVAPVVDALDRLPINVLLALGHSATRPDRKFLLNLPKVFSDIFGDVSRARRVFNLHVWAPTLDDPSAHKYLGDIAEHASQDENEHKTIRVERFLDLLGKYQYDQHVAIAPYEIVHCIGICGSTSRGEPLLFLGDKQVLQAGILRDALVRYRTRLLILHELGGFREGDVTDRFASFVAGAGGPAVLVVGDDQSADSSSYFRELYGRIAGNRPIETLEAGRHEGIDALLIAGEGGGQLLQLDSLKEQLARHLSSYQEFADGLVTAISELDEELRGDIVRKEEEHSLLELRLKIRDAFNSDWLSATTDVTSYRDFEAIELAQAFDHAVEIDRVARSHAGEGPLHTKFDDLRQRLDGAARDQEVAARLETRRQPPDEAKESDEITVFFGTNRSRASGDTYYGAERDSLHFGKCLVNVPADRPLGSIQRPSIWTLYREDKSEHFLIVKVEELGRDAFIGELRDYVKDCSSKQALVFVHGFNVRFRDAIFRTAQMAVDLEFPGAAIAFSWPSKGRMSLLGYNHDAQQVRWTLPDLTEFLELVAEQSGATMIHLVAHSMGNRALTEALMRIGAESSKQGGAAFNEVILTAPDIDAGTFSRDIVPKILPKARRVTLYAAANDIALKFSKTVNSFPMAGDSGPGIVVCKGIDTIDVSGVNTDFVGHFYYGNNRTVLSDMFNLIKGEPADTRFGLKKKMKGDQCYWVFKPD